MEAIVAILALANFVLFLALFAGLLRPKWVRQETRGGVLKIYGIGTLVSAIAFGVLNPDPEPGEAAEVAIAEEVTPEEVVPAEPGPELTWEERLRARILDSIGPSNRDVPRIEEVAMYGDELVIVWAINKPHQGPEDQNPESPFKRYETITHTIEFTVPSTHLGGGTDRVWSYYSWGIPKVAYLNNPNEPPKTVCKYRYQGTDAWYTIPGPAPAPNPYGGMRCELVQMHGWWYVYLHEYRGGMDYSIVVTYEEVKLLPAQ